MAVSTGSYTVGSGGDYPTFLGAAGALADIANLTGDLTFTQISDITESDAAVAVDENLAGHTLTITSNGNWTLTMGTDVACRFHFEMEGPGTININDLCIVNTVDSANAKFYIVNIATACTINIYNIKMDLGAASFYAMYLNDNTPTVNCWNWAVKGPAAVAGNGLGFNVIAGNVANKYENISCHGCAINAGGQGGTFKNCVAVATNGVTARFANLGAATGTNCASDDATNADGNWSSGSGNQTNITVADEFASTTFADDTFLKVKSGGVCDDGGATPGIATNTTGIRGNARPSISDGASVSIGADQLQVTASSTVKHDEGIPGDVIRLSGTGFGLVQGTGSVTVGGSTATIVSWSNTQIICVVPGCQVGNRNIVVTNSDGESATVAFKRQYKARRLGIRLQRNYNKPLYLVG